MATQELTLIEHLEELRWRLIKSIVSLLITSLLSYFFVDSILRFIARPIGKLVFLYPTEALLIRIKVALVTGIFLSSPIIIYQLWQFIVPALLPREKKPLHWILPVSFILFLAGISFAYFIVLPLTLRVLLSLGTETIQPLISVDYYVSFLLFFILSFGLVFQIPLIILFVVYTGIISLSTLTRGRRYAILVILIVAAVLTPGPDVVTQMLLFVPGYALYELGIFLSRFLVRLKI